MAPQPHFSDIALDHARNPRNYGIHSDYDEVVCIKGACGDTMAISVRIRYGRIHRILFLTDGCGSSLACGSMTTELAKGKTVEEAYMLEAQDVVDALGGFPEESRHCAELAIQVLRACCERVIRGS